MASGLLKTYLGEGLAAARPATPSVGANTIAFWYSTDSAEMSAYVDGAWLEDVLGGGSPVYTDITGVPTDTFLGRDTAGTGPAEALSVATAKTLLGLTGTNSGDQTITLTGDVTGSGTGSFATAIGANKVLDTMLRDSAALTVIGRSANSTGDPADIAAGTDNQVLRRSGTALAFGAVNLASSDAVTGDLALSNIAQASAASKLLGRGSASGAGDFQEITLGTNLSMSGTTLNATGGGGLSDGDMGDVVVGGSGTTLTVESATPASGILEVTGQIRSTNKIVINGGTGVTAFVDFWTNGFLCGKLQAYDGNNGLIYAFDTHSFRNKSQANDILVMTTALATFSEDVVVPDEAYDATAWNGSLEVPTKNAVRDRLESAGWITSANLRDSSALSVIGRSANSTGVPADIAGTNNTVLRVSGSVLGFGAIDVSTAQITGDLPFANLAQGAALSVLGVTGNAGADVASIAAASDGQVLRRSGTTVAFGAVDLASANAVTGDLAFSNIAQIATSRFVGRVTAATGDIEALTGTQATTLLDVFTTSLKGVVPAGNATKQYLRSDATWQDDIRTITFIIDGGGATITTGLKGYLEIPFACTIQQWTLLADQSGSIVVDLWKDTYANYPPVVGDVITASAKPTITTATKGQSSTLTGWTTAIAAGDILAFNVNSVTTCQRVTISIKVKCD